MAIKDIENAIRHGRAVMDDHWDAIARNERATRYAIIDPVIWALGWETWDPAECQVEFQRGRQGKVDYALFNSEGKPVILIEAKRMDVDSARSEEQLAKYGLGMREGVGVLTDGQLWHLYDFGKEGRFSNKHVASVDISNDGVRRAARQLNDLLSKGKWWQGTVISPRPS